MKYLSLGLILAVTVFGLSACTHAIDVGIGDGSNNEFGKLDVYGTDRVPFQYEEIGIVVAQGSRKSAVKEFSKRTLALGADAVLNLRIQYGVTGGTAGFGIVVGVTTNDRNRIVISGVAVRKIRAGAN